MDLSVQIGSLTLKNPLITSGCFGRRRMPMRSTWPRSVELPSRDCSWQNAKAIRTPRIVETPAGMLNAIGLQGIGVHRFIDEKSRSSAPEARP